MLFRISIILVCLIAFITGCNSLVSQFAGTHRLRSYAIEEIEFEGAGDADYLEIRGGWQTGDFVYGKPRKAGQKGIIQYPVVGEARLEKRDRGTAIPVSVIVWQALPDPACVASASCAEKKETLIRGIVRRIPPRGNELEALTRKGYLLAENVVFIEAGQAPIAWYWLVLIMLAAAILAIGMEWRYLQQLTLDLRVD